MAKKTEPTTEADTVHTSGSGSATTNHDVIRKWAEARGGRPATVQGTERGDDAVGMIRLEFPGAPGANDDKLSEISWDEWFAKFDEGGLALLYQEHTADGQLSNFNKLVKQETAAMATAEPVRTTAKKATAKTASKRTPAAKKTVAKTAGKKVETKKAPVAKKAAAKKVPAAKKSAKKTPVARTAAAKKTAAKKAPAAKTATKKSAKKVPAARGYRGR